MNISFRRRCSGEKGDILLFPILLQSAGADCRSMAQCFKTCLLLGARQSRRTTC
jgi:hypothetical protein